MNVQVNGLAIRRQDRGEGTLAEHGTSQSLDAGAGGSSLLFSADLCEEPEVFSGQTT